MSVRKPVFVGPEPWAELLVAVNENGCEAVEDIEGASAVVWFGRDPSELIPRLHERLEWLQLPDAGVEKWIQAGVLERGGTVTSARGAYGRQVAEHALALILAVKHGLPAYARETQWNPAAAAVSVLAGSRVVVLGGGGIGTHLLTLLSALGCHTDLVARDATTAAAADSVVGFDELGSVLPLADVVVLAAPATPDTLRIIDRRALSLMRPHAVVVNVARGDLVQTDDLVVALDDGTIGWAALDVTDPEPLPDGHPLLGHPRVILTPHVANPPQLKRAAFVARVTENCSRYASGAQLVGLIDRNKGY